MDAYMWPHDLAVEAVWILFVGFIGDMPGTVTGEKDML